MIFSATAAFRKVTDISPEMLAKMNIKGLILDVDNTLTTHDNPQPADGVVKWIYNMRENGIKMIIVSNNHPPRVQPFAELLGLNFVCEGRKPLTKGYRQAIRQLGLNADNVAPVGDQIFTDILGANLTGIKSFYVAPIKYEETAFFKFKRTMEIPFIPKKFVNRENR